MLASLTFGAVAYEPITFGSSNDDSSTSSSVYGDTNSGGYESSSGNRYEYDLNDPADRVRYGSDPSAQIRDRTNPRVGIDRDMDQYGGGIYD
ncbi:hypothetical protein LG290_02945 [Halomonas sediminis]